MQPAILISISSFLDAKKVKRAVHVYQLVATSSTIDSSNSSSALSSFIPSISRSSILSSLIPSTSGSSTASNSASSSIAIPSASGSCAGTSTSECSSNCANAVSAAEACFQLTGYDTDCLCKTSKFSGYAIDCLGCAIGLWDNFGALLNEPLELCSLATSPTGSITCSSTIGSSSSVGSSSTPITSSLAIYL
ncbi:unnamed protein product [Ambrosiozyma monospora]|uniref:Unnamed protein product n=1 Tax=Ambrosiozyma monospora TaxID=43982 RepID=A0ACB5TL36_AMBMO|nr:unnamed protein product [Ambrosiozyma monospora]